MNDVSHPTNPAVAARLAAIEAQLGQVSADLARLVARQEAVTELVDELGPISKAMMQSATERLDALDKRGWFTFARGMGRVADRVVGGTDPAELDALADSILAILGTVRALTRPEVLALAQEGAEVLEDAEEANPIGVIGLAQASRDTNVQKGLGILVAGLRHVGRASRVLGKRSRGLVGQAALDRPRAAPAPAAPVFQASASAASSVGGAARPGTQVPAAAPFAGVAGVSFDAQGFLVDASTWSEELAVAIAVDLGLPPLSERHWLALRTARRIHAASGESPNIRKLTTSSELDTKELYALFPHAPGKTVARLAGLPKPVGCL